MLGPTTGNVGKFLCYTVDTHFYIQMRPLLLYGSFVFLLQMCWFKFKVFFFFFNKSTSTLPLKYLCFRSTVYILNYTLGYIFWLLHMGNCFSLFNLKVSFKTFWWMIIINAAKWWIWGSKHKSVMFRWTWAVHCLEIEFTIELCSCYSSKHMEKKFFFL